MNSEEESDQRPNRPEEHPTLSERLLNEATTSNNSDLLNESIDSLTSQRPPGSYIASAYMIDEDVDDTGLEKDYSLWGRLGAATVVGLLCLYGAFQFLTHTPLIRPDGMMAAAVPVQTMLAQPQSMRFKTAHLEKVAQYQFTARVLHTTSSWMDAVAEVSPMDVGIGWGALSDQKIVDQFEFGQTDRHLFFAPKNQSAWRVLSQLENKLANVHTIPANETVARQLKALRPGHIIEAQGYLVNLTMRNGSRFNTSLTREDRGDGACEIMYIENLRIVH